MSKNGKVLLQYRIMMATDGCHGNNVYKLCFNDTDMFINMCLMKRNKLKNMCDMFNTLKLL